jgi:cation:H+ antiporter
MALILALPLFAVSLVVTLAAAATFARRLDRLGARFGLPEVVIGLLTAMAADGPEVSSAVAALVKGSRAAGVGVIVGSNAFNLAAMLGVSALVVGRVRVRVRTLLLEGGVGLAVTVIAIALLLGALPVAAALVLLACVLVPYVAVAVAGARLAAHPRLPASVVRFIHSAIEEDESPAVPQRAIHFATRRQLLLMAGDVVLIVAGSVGMVQAALSLGSRWGIASALVGVLVLGPLTSLPNALTGVRLGLARRGAALVTETLNSNTINLVAAVSIPALFVTLTTHSTTDRVDLAILVAMTVVALALLARPTGLGRLGGVVLIGMYGAFAVVELVVS